MYIVLMDIKISFLAENTRLKNAYKMVYIYKKKVDFQINGFRALSYFKLSI